MDTNLLYSMDLIDSSNSSLESVDYFILACGSDSRAYEVLARFRTKKIKIGKILLLQFKERLIEIDENDSLFKYRELGFENIQEIDCEVKIPNSCLDKLADNDLINRKIAIDISCLTKPYLYFLIKLFKEKFEINNLCIYYTEPKSYLFQKGLFNNFHTNSGPLEILEIPGFSGLEERGSKRILIILLGFDGDLSKEINMDISPSETTVVNGFPSYSPKFKDISLIANEKLVSDHKIVKRYARANNPFDTYNLLQSIEGEFKDDLPFINIAPLGTKPMALGACLYALHNPNVRVIYPLPDKYENKYSDMCWSSWKYILPLAI